MKNVAPKEADTSEGAGDEFMPQTPMDTIELGVNKAFDYNTEMHYEYNFNDCYVTPIDKSKRNWSAYNQAEMNEIEMFDPLLKDLVDAIEEPDHTWGRKPIPWKDLLFIVIKKAYTQLPGRRFQHEINGLYEKGLISMKPHWSILSDRLRHEEITPHLKSVFRQTYMPFSGIETEFAVDASGFRASSAGMYIQTRHQHKHRIDWIKAHIAIGLETKIITAAKLTEGYCADITQMSGILQGINEDFEIKYVYADKGYMSRKVIDEIYDLGATPFIPFKTNALTRSRGARHWKKAFYFFHLHNDEFNAQYHKRSNVEATFGAIKKKLGETLKSKCQQAQQNELLCKIIAYNISIVIKEMHKKGHTFSF